LLLAAVLLVISLGLLTAGLSGLLLGKENQPVVVVDFIETPTITVATPTPSSAAVARLIIEKIGVDAPVITLALDENGSPQTFDGPYDVAWYDFTGKPGWGSNAVFAGHFDWTVNAQPVTGVFYSLRDLTIDDIIEVRLKDGTGYNYRVIGNLAVPDGDRQLLELMRATPSDMVTLITCGALWPPATPEPYGFYQARQVVRAELIREALAAPTDNAYLGDPRQEDSTG